MQFTYEEYRKLIASIESRKYVISSYHNWQDSSRCVILRHDIDYDLEKAVKLAQIEAEEQVQSTYFLLLRTNFYNPASKESLEKIRMIQSMGHEIGLHFDEKAYDFGTPEKTIERILRERDILSMITDTPVNVVSMHRPSRTTLEADLKIPGMINSYSKTFFRDFKYLSDSRCRWREPVLDIIQSNTYDRLHILTHAFWYGNEIQSMKKTVNDFIVHAQIERYGHMKNNITDLAAIVCD